MSQVRADGYRGPWERAFTDFEVRIPHDGFIEYRRALDALGGERVWSDWFRVPPEMEGATRVLDIYGDPCWIRESP